MAAIALTPTPTEEPSIAPYPAPLAEQTNPDWGWLLLLILIAAAGLILYYYGFVKNK